MEPVGKDLHSGIQSEFLKRIRELKGKTDSLSTPVFDKQTANEVLSKWTDSLKNLTVIRNMPYVKADRAGDSWVFKLNDGKIIRPRVLIAAGDRKLMERLAIKVADSTQEMPLDYAGTSYRTSVASGKHVGGHGTATVFSLYSLLIADQENLIWLSPKENMLSGQAAGATAAYAAFYGTKTSASNLNAIQGELIHYKLALMPFADVSPDDPNWKAIQFVGLTGVMKAEIQEQKACFLPGKMVTIAEIKQPLKAFYSKAQLWFDDHAEGNLSLKLAIDLVCYVGNKSPESTLKAIEKNWKTGYKLSSDFDLEKVLTRREFALLLHDYLPPFNVNVDKRVKW
ncbi:hypothetical protein D9M68_663230 [compost metagenome]